MTPFADDCRFDVPAISASVSPARCAVCGDTVASHLTYCAPCRDHILNSPSFRVEAEGELYPYGSPRTYADAVTLAEKNAADFGKRFLVRRFISNRDSETGEVLFTTPEAS